METLKQMLDVPTKEQVIRKWQEEARLLDKCIGCDFNRDNNFHDNLCKECWEAETNNSIYE